MTLRHDILKGNTARTVRSNHPASAGVLQAVGAHSVAIIVFLGDHTVRAVAKSISASRSFQAQKNTGINNNSQTFYRYDATATATSKPRHGVVYHSEDGGRDGRVLSAAWRPHRGEG